MFCSKCGANNGSVWKFCFKCGTPYQNLNTNQSNTQQPMQQVINNNPQPNPNQQMNQQPINNQPIRQPSNDENKPLKEKRKKKFKIRYIFLALFLFIVGVLIFNWGQSLYYKYQRDQKLKFLQPTAVEKIYDSFTNGDINPDTFVKQLAYSLFDTNQLDEQFNLGKKEKYMASHVLEEMEKHWDEVSDSTKEYIAQQYLLTDLGFGTNASNNTASINIPGIETVYASSVSVTTLNKALLSSDKNFIIWYTDKGESKISDKTAQQIAEKLVSSVNKIKTDYGYDFKYEAINNLGRPNVTRDMKSVLTANNIDSKYLDTTLPIYVYFSGNQITSGALAYYGPGLDVLGGGLLMKVASNTAETGEMKSVPSFPYMIILPDSIKDKEDFDLIATHELFHHYQPYICGNGNYKKCSSGLFTTETTANLVAATSNDIKSKDTILHKHLAGYINSTGLPVDNPHTRFWGYNSYTFAKVYSDLVPNGKKIIMDSMNKKEASGIWYTGMDGPLEYLNDQAGSKMVEVMETLAEKNLTNDYNYGAMKSKYKPFGKGKMCNTECTSREFLFRLGINYHYFDMNDYKAETEIYINTTIYEKEKISSASVLIFGLKNNYQLLKKFSLKEDIILNTKDYSGYDEIVIVVVADTDIYVDNNGNRFDTDYYTIQVAKKELLEITQVTAPSRDNECITFDYDGLLDSLKTVYTLYGQVVDEVGKTFERDTSGFLEQLEKDKAALDEARNAPIKTISVCIINIDLSKDDNQLHKDVKKYLYFTKFKVFDHKEGDSRTTVHISANIKGDTRSAILSTHPTQKQLILISIMMKDEI